MYTVRHLSGSLSDLVSPNFRKIDFADEPATALVAGHLREAWSAIPPSSLPAEVDKKELIASFMKENSSRTDEERAAAPQNPDITTINTVWRDAIYWMWNHVFWNVSCFLQEAAAPGVGHLHPPAEDAFAIEERVNSRAWDKPVLITPAYLAPGVAVRGSVTEEETRDIGTFDETKTTEVWWIKNGVEVEFTIEGDLQSEGTKIKAVIVYAVMCLGDGQENTNEGEGEGK